MYKYIAHALQRAEYTAQNICFSKCFKNSLLFVDKKMQTAAKTNQFTHARQYNLGSACRTQNIIYLINTSHNCCIFNSHIWHDRGAFRSVILLRLFIRLLFPILITSIFSSFVEIFSSTKYLRKSHFIYLWNENTSFVIRKCADKINILFTFKQIVFEWMKVRPNAAKCSEMRIHSIFFSNLFNTNASHILYELDVSSFWKTANNSHAICIHRGFACCTSYIFYGKYGE